MRHLTTTLPLCGLVGCATLTRDSLDQACGPADPTRHDQPLPPQPGGLSYRAEVQPILEQRCVVCHGCYDAPCQLKLGAWEGIARGASKLAVYDPHGCAPLIPRDCSKTHNGRRSGARRTSTRC